MPTDNVAVVNGALALLGENPITAMTDATFVAKTANRLYEGEILNLLSLTPWRFAAKRATLSRDASAPTPRNWKYGYTLPTLDTDRVGSVAGFYASAGPGATRLLEFEVGQTWCFTDVETVIADYTWRAPEAQWPGYFAKLAIHAVAALLALPITENQTRADALSIIAFGSPGMVGRGGLMGAALVADKAGGPTKSLIDDHDLMAEARFGG